MISTDITVLKDEVVNSGNELVDWYQSQNDAYFNREIVPYKWTPAQHLVHLTKSVKGVRKGLEMSPEALKRTFGYPKRDEWAYDKLSTNYREVLDQGAVAPANMSPNSESNFVKEESISKFESETQKLLSAMNNWNNEGISKYGLPHPRMGLLSIREMLMFCVLHNRHHLTALVKNYTI